MAIAIDVEDILPFPREAVFGLYMNELPELADHLPNMDAITCEERTLREDGRLYLVNRWRAARTEVPVLARPFVKPHMLEWLDYALWDLETYRVEWRMETVFMTEAVRVSGVNAFHVEGEHTRLHITGTLDLDTDQVPGLPRFMRARAKRVLEPFVIRLIQPNLTAINRGLEEVLRERSDDQSGGPFSSIS